VGKGGSEMWIKSDLRWFNGLVQSCKRGPAEVGIFREKYPISGRYWSIRKRPLDSFGNVYDSWGLPITFETKREALAFYETEWK